MHGTSFFCVILIPVEFRIPSILIPKGEQQCNICGVQTGLWLTRGHNNHATQKYDIIGGKKRKVNCLNCGSSDRDRLLKHFFDDITPIGNLLHVAPEKALSRYLKGQSNLNITKIDKKVGWYKLVYGYNVKYGDLTKLPFEDGCFDWVIANHVLEHIKDEQQAIYEIYRVLKQDGKAILQIPFSFKIKSTIEGEYNWTSTERESQLGQKDHVRLYGLDFPNRWNLFHVQFYSLKDEVDFKRFNLNPQEPVILVSKTTESKELQHFKSIRFEKILKT